MKEWDISQSLIINHEQVIDLLNESIRVGLYIGNNICSLRYPISIAELQYEMWDKYNHFILKKLTATSEVIEEYDNAQPDIYIEDIYDHPSSLDLLERVSDRILLKVNKIKSFAESISAIQVQECDL